MYPERATCIRQHCVRQHICIRIQVARPGHVKLYILTTHLLSSVVPLMQCVHKPLRATNGTFIRPLFLLQIRLRIRSHSRAGHSAYPDDPLPVSFSRSMVLQCNNHHHHNNHNNNSINKTASTPRSSSLHSCFKSQVNMMNFVHRSYSADLSDEQIVSCKEATL